MASDIKYVKRDIEHILDVDNLYMIAKLLNSDSMYNKAYASLNFNNYDFMSPDGTKLSWNLSNVIQRNKLRDVVSINFYACSFQQTIANTNRNRVSFLIEEFKGQSFMCPSGRRFHALGEVYTNVFVDFTAKTLIHNDQFNFGRFEFYPPMTIADTLTLSVGDPLELISFSNRLFDNVTFDFTSWPTILINGTFDLPLNTTGWITYIKNFNTDNPIADELIIDYMNSPHGYLCLLSSNLLPNQIQLNPIFPDGTINYDAVNIANLTSAIVPPIGVQIPCQLDVNVTPDKLMVLMEITYLNPSISTKNKKPMLRRETGVFNEVSKTSKNTYKIDSIGSIFTINKLLGIFNRRALFKRHYVSLDTSNATETQYGSKIYKWNVEEGLVRHAGCTAVNMPLKNIVGFRLFPLFAWITHNTKLVPQTDVALLVHEFSAQSFIDNNGRKYHFFMNSDPVIFDALNQIYMNEYRINDCNDGMYWFNTIYKHVTTLTLEFMQKVPSMPSTNNMQTVDLVFSIITANNVFQIPGWPDTLFFNVNIYDFYIYEFQVITFVVTQFMTGLPSDDPIIEIITNPNGWPVSDYTAKGNTSVMGIVIPGLDALPFSWTVIGDILIKAASANNYVNMEFITLDI